METLSRPHISVLFLLAALSTNCSSSAGGSSTTVSDISIPPDTSAQPDVGISHDSAVPEDTMPFADTVDSTGNEDSQSSSTDSAAASCDVTGFPAASYQIFDASNQDYQLYLAVSDSGREILQIGFYSTNTSPSPFSGPGSYPVGASSADLNYSTCQTCVQVFDGCDGDACERGFFANEGLIEISNYDRENGKLTGRLVGALLRESTIAEDFTSTPVPGGVSWCIEAFAIDAHSSGCTDDADCPGQFCDPETSTCVACTNDTDCPDEGSAGPGVCVLSEGVEECVGCFDDGDCTSKPGKNCDGLTFTCVAVNGCHDALDCELGMRCDLTANQCVAGCDSSNDCLLGQKCDAVLNKCVVGCDEDDRCPDLGSFGDGACVTRAGVTACVGCRDSTDCDANQICEADGNCARSPSSYSQAILTVSVGPVVDLIGMQATVQYDSSKVDSPVGTFIGVMMGATTQTNDTGTSVTIGGFLSDGVAGSGDVIRITFTIHSTSSPPAEADFVLSGLKLSDSNAEPIPTISTLILTLQ